MNPNFTLFIPGNSNHIARKMEKPEFRNQFFDCANCCLQNIEGLRQWNLIKLSQGLLEMVN